MCWLPNCGYRFSVCLRSLSATKPLTAVGRLIDVGILSRPLFLLALYSLLLLSPSPETDCLRPTSGRRRRSATPAKFIESTQSIQTAATAVTVKARGE